MEIVYIVVVVLLSLLMVMYGLLFCFVIVGEWLLVCVCVWGGGDKCEGLCKGVSVKK